MFKIISDSSTRIKTGLALIIGVLLIGFINSFFLMWFLFGSLMMIAINEAMKLFNIDDDSIYLYASITWIVAYFYPKPEDLIFIVGIIFASNLAYSRKLNKQLFLPLMYPMISFLSILSLYISFGIDVLFWLLVVVAGTDIGAYFIGKSIGSKKFCETSPNKTLEGVIGGVVTATILGIIFSPDIGFFTALIISLFVAIASIFGDLFESYLKREANLKDSGDILPGHGGILDRTDGYLFASIVMLVMLRFIS